jgi:transcriptional regulator with XRE-family HTH domain
MSQNGWADGAQIRRLRKAQNLTVRELAERVGIARQYLSLIEVGVKKQPSIDTLAGIARELGESLGNLVVIASPDEDDGEPEAA